MGANLWFAWWGRVAPVGADCLRQWGASLTTCLKWEELRGEAAFDR